MDQEGGDIKTIFFFFLVNGRKHKSHKINFVTQKGDINILDLF